MPTGIARKSATSARPSVKARKGKGRPDKPDLLYTIVQTFEVDGRPLQSATDFWNGRPIGAESHECPDRPGVFVTTRLWCPYDKAYYAPLRSLGDTAKATS